MPDTELDDFAAGGIRAAQKEMKTQPHPEGTIFAPRLAAYGRKKPNGKRDAFLFLLPVDEQAPGIRRQAAAVVGQMLGSNGVEVVAASFVFEACTAGKMTRAEYDEWKARQQGAPPLEAFDQTSMVGIQMLASFVKTLDGRTSGCLCEIRRDCMTTDIEFGELRTDSLLTRASRTGEYAHCGILDAFVDEYMDAMAPDDEVDELIQQSRKRKG